MSMRKRYITFRVSDAEYQIIKTKAEQAGVSAPVVARRLALDTAQIDQLGVRLDQIERQLKNVPDGGAVLAAFEKLAVRIAALQALAAKIDQATTKGVAP